MNIKEKEFSTYLTILRFLVFKITPNLQRIYIDFDQQTSEIILTALYKIYPTEIELELLDDIVTNSNAHIPNFIIKEQYFLIEEFKKEKHDYTVFATYDGSAAASLQFMV